MSAVHKSTRREGGQPGNGNARKGLELPAGYSLDSSVEVTRFLREVLLPSTMSGVLGSRAASAINSQLKLLLDFNELLVLRRRVSELELLDRERRSRDVSGNRSRYSIIRNLQSPATGDQPPTQGSLPRATSSRDQQATGVNSNGN